MPLSWWIVLALIGGVSATVASGLCRRAAASSSDDAEVLSLINARNGRIVDAAFFLYMALVTALDLALGMRAWYGAHQDPFPAVSGLIMFGMIAAFGVIAGCAAGGAVGHQRRLVIARQRPSRKDAKA